MTAITILHVDRKSMLDGGTNCGKGEQLWQPYMVRGPFMVPCLVRPDHLRHGQPSYGVTDHWVKPGGTADIGVKMEKIPGVIKGRFYVTTSLSDS